MEKQVETIPGAIKYPLYFVAAILLALVAMALSGYDGFPIFLSLVMGFFSALLCLDLAHAKNRSRVLWFFVGLLFPIISVVMIHIASDRAKDVSIDRQLQILNDAVKRLRRKSLEDLVTFGERSSQTTCAACQNGSRHATLEMGVRSIFCGEFETGVDKAVTHCPKFLKRVTEEVEKSAAQTGVLAVP